MFADQVLPSYYNNYDGLYLAKCFGKYLRGPWRQLPENVRVRLRYAASRIPHYTEIHRIANFAGNLEHLKAAYATGSVEARADLSNQFNSIADQLTLPNGVTSRPLPIGWQTSCPRCYLQSSCRTRRSACSTCLPQRGFQAYKTLRCSKIVSSDLLCARR